MKVERQIKQNLLKNTIYEDKHILVINKPINLAVQGGNKVKYSMDNIINIDSEITYRLTHRLDKDTSGLLILAKSEKSAKKITKLFKDKKINKTYIALVTGVPPKKHGVINLSIAKKKQKNGKEMMQIVRNEPKLQSAITEYEVIDRAAKKLSLLMIKPITGKKHQIRIHLTSLDTPILGDGKYGGKSAFIDNLSNKIHLHAYKINIENYYGKTLDITAPMPDHMKETCDLFGFIVD